MDSHLCATELEEAVREQEEAKERAQEERRRAEAGRCAREAAMEEDNDSTGVLDKPQLGSVARERQLCQRATITTPKFLAFSTKENSHQKYISCHHHCQYLIDC